MPDLNALRSFVLAAETLNFSVAAERRNTVQSAISAHIRKLEDELQRALFVRGRGQAMHLTAEGEAFAVYARRILSMTEEAVEAIRTAQSRRIIRLGTTVTLAMSVVTNALRAFSQARPDVQIHIQCDRSDALLTRLDANEIDLAFMMDQGKRPGRIFVGAVPLVWAAGPGFRLEGSGDVPLAFLSDGRDLRHYAFEALDRIGRKGYIAHLSVHPIGVRAFVLAGLAATVMPDITVVPPLFVPEPALGLPALQRIALSAYRQAGATSDDLDLLSELLFRRAFEGR